jgi:two-component system nitrogen regulation response regulator GlnG
VPIELAGRVVLLLHLDDEPGQAAGEHGMIGHGPGIRRVRAAIDRVAGLDTPVLVRGETGTGKELVARAIHERSARRGGPLVSLNLGLARRELAAAELFGWSRGARAGANREPDGLLRAARGGTLFLDDVDQGPPDVQLMLLRLLETGPIHPVGPDRQGAVDVRVVAATAADLEGAAGRGRFSAPLLDRLCVHEVSLPPLRARREDIGPLIIHFARQELEAIGELARLSPSDPHARPWLPAPIAARLLRHAWPGNIRQLRNVTRRLVLGSRGRAQVDLDPRLAAELAGAAGPGPASRARAYPPPPRRRRPSQVSEEELVGALRACAWDLKAAADRLGIPRPSIYDLIERSQNVRTAGELGADEIARSFRECGGDLDAMVTRLQVSKRALNRRIRALGLGNGPVRD